MQNQHITYRNRPSLISAFDESHHNNIEVFDRGGYDFFELFRNRRSTESLESLLKMLYRQEKFLENWIKFTKNRSGGEK